MVSGPTSRPIIENKLNVSSLKRTMKRIAPGWEIYHNFSHSDFGRIMIVWNSNSVNIQVLNQSAQSIHCLAEIRSRKLPFFFTCVYTFNTATMRVPLWREMKLYSGSIQGAWLILGDFNCLLKPEEKINGAPVRTKDLRELNFTTGNCGLMDLKYSGSFFTCSNRRKTGPRLMSKLDKVLVNHDWIQCFVDSNVVFINPGISNHSLSLGICNPEIQPKHPFKFINSWCLH